jgi:OmpA-OmpF porin, OOP family
MSHNLAWMPDHLCCKPKGGARAGQGLLGLIGRKSRRKGADDVVSRRRVMRVFSKNPKTVVLLSALAITAPGNLSAQQQVPDAPSKDIVVTGQPEVPVADPAAVVPGAPLPKGPEIKGIISARSGERLQVTTADGAKTIIAFNDATQIKSSSGIFSRAKLDRTSLLNGLPVTVRTLQSGDALMASRITLRGTDLKTANMIRHGTAQGFSEQTAATEALRGRMGDIDEYNIKATTNVNFATGKAVLSPQGKADLCSTATAASGVKNALILVAGHTDSTGSDEFNQVLSERRASSVVNYIQQACGWKPYRMLTPAGMSKSDPVADNVSAAGKAQNRRVSVSILVSKGLDGL